MCHGEKYWRVLAWPNKMFQAAEAQYSENKLVSELKDKKIMK